MIDLANLVQQGEIIQRFNNGQLMTTYQWRAQPGVGYIVYLTSDGVNFREVQRWIATPDLDCGFGITLSPLVKATPVCVSVPTPAA